jgi:hypothetical protein
MLEQLLEHAECDHRPPPSLIQGSTHTCRLATSTSINCPTSLSLPSTSGHWTHTCTRPTHRHNKRWVQGLGPFHLPPVTGAHNWNLQPYQTQPPTMMMSITPCAHGHHHPQTLVTQSYAVSQPQLQIHDHTNTLSGQHVLQHHSWLVYLACPTNPPPLPTSFESSSSNSSDTPCLRTLPGPLYCCRKHPTAPPPLPPPQLACDPLYCCRKPS